MSTIVTRAGKGSALTHNEVDANFNNLNNDKIEAAQSVTLTNKTISGSNNTLSNIGNSSLTNSSVTLGSTSVSLGSTVTSVSGLSLTGGAINNATIGASTATTGAFTTLSASSTVSGTGFSTYLASPPAIGGTAAAAGSFTTLSATGVTTVQAGTVSAPAITTSGDTNTGIFFPAADTIAFTEGGVESMRIDSSGNVGVGTTSVLSTVGRVVQILNSGSSAATLQLQDSTTGSTASDGLQLQVNGATSYLWSYENGPLIFGTNNTERMRIDSSGNLGLGVTPSAWGNGVSMQGSAWALSTTLGTDCGAYYVNARQTGYASIGSSCVYRTTAPAGAYGIESAVHKWYTAPSGTAGNAITFTQAMTLDANGKLSIGTTSAPSGSGVRAVISNANGGGLQFDQSGSGGAVLPNGGSAGLLFFTYTGGVGSESYTERARIDSSGFTQFSSNLVMPYQGAPTSKSGAATLTGAELVTGILNTTGTTYTITLPTGTNIEGALTWSANNVSLDWYVINTASGTITIGANGNTTLGSLTIATGTSAHFRIRRTAANTFTVYRL